MIRRVAVCLVVLFALTTLYGAVAWPEDFYAEENDPEWQLLLRGVARDWERVWAW